MKVYFKVYCNYVDNVYQIKAQSKQFEQYNKICYSMPDLMAQILVINQALRLRYKVVITFV